MSTAVTARRPSIEGMTRRLLGVVAALLAVQFVAACSIVTSNEPGPVVTPRPPTSIQGAVPVRALGLNIPWAVGGERIERDGTLKVSGGDWPDVPFRALRLWDTRTAWLNLEPAPDQWAFDQLDALVDKARGNGITDITLVLGGTPQWAASAVYDTDASWLGPGSASMPVDLDAWREFVATVASRYAGRITSYEIGNEPNLRTFWSGTPDQYAQFVAAAATAVAESDPNAGIVVNGGLVRSKYDIATLSKWLTPLAAAGLPSAIHAISLHVYPTVDRIGDPTAQLLSGMRGALTATGWGTEPAWITEVNVRDGARLTPELQSAAVRSLGDLILATGFERAYWYAWTDMGTDEMVRFQPGSGGSAGLAALS